MRDSSNTLKVRIKTSGNSYFNSGGNVGIGTDAPQAKLDVAGAIKANTLEVGEISTSIGTVSAAGDTGVNAETITLTTTTGLSAGAVYFLGSSGWVASDASSISTSIGLMGVATSNTSADGMVIRGIVRTATDPGGSVGDICYLSATTGILTTTPVSTTGDINRVMGYKIGTNLVFFNPSQDWIEIS